MTSQEYSTPLRRSEPRDALAGSTSASDQSTMRNANLALVANELFGQKQGVSRAALAAQTGLTRATVSSLVRDLIDMGIAEEEEKSEAVGRGRPGTPLVPASGKIIGVGLEVNVDHVAGVAIDLRGEVIDSFEASGRFLEADPSAALDVLAKQVAGLVRRLERRGVQEICGMSLAVPGVVDESTGTVIYAPNLDWKDVRPGDHLGSSIEATEELTVDNDANLQAVAEDVELSNSLVRPQTFFYISGDYGIGGAIVTEGQITRGTRGWAGEVGHLTIDPAGPKCHCGSTGCLEQYAGARAIRIAAGLEEGATTGELLGALESGDTRAIAAVESAGHALGIAISDVVKLLDIETVILGTNLAPLVPWLLPTLNAELNHRLLARKANDLRVLSGDKGQHLAARGGAYRALRERLKMT